MALLIVGVTEDGAAAFSVPLNHGADPDTVVFDQGYQALRPLEAGWRGADLALRLRVRPLHGESRPEPLPPRTDAGLIISDDVVPMTRQRVAAYAVVVSDRGLLATQYSSRPRWTVAGACPAAASTNGEEPAAGVLPRGARGDRPGRRARRIWSRSRPSHWVGRSPGGRWRTSTPSG